MTLSGSEQLREKGIGVNLLNLLFIYFLEAKIEISEQAWWDDLKCLHERYSIIKRPSLSLEG